jgi:hypothetical protein
MPKIAKNIPSPRNHAAERQKKTESTPIQGAREKPPSFRRGYAIGSPVGDVPFDVEKLK